MTRHFSSIALYLDIFIDDLAEFNLLNYKMHSFSYIDVLLIFKILFFGNYIIFGTLYNSVFLD